MSLQSELEAPPCQSHFQHIIINVQKKGGGVKSCKLHMINLTVSTTLVEKKFGSVVLTHMATVILSGLISKVGYYAVKIQCLPMISRHRCELRIRTHSNKLPIQAILLKIKKTTHFISLDLLAGKTNILFTYQKEG